MRIVIIQTAFIGDVILCTSLIESLKQAGHSVGFVLKPEAANILENDDRVDCLHVFDKRGSDAGLFGLFRIIKGLKEERYDAAVIPHRSLRSSALAKLAGIPKRIGFDRSTGSWLFTDVVEYDRSCHEVERNNKLIASVEISEISPAPVVKSSNEDCAVVQEQFDAWGITDSDIIVGLGPGSEWRTKQWGVDKYTELTALLESDERVKVICFGGPGDTALCIEICSKGRTFNAAGKFTLSQSSAALKKVCYAVSNDNGFMHLASASGIAVTAIFGPTVPAFGFTPWGDGHTVVERDLYCRPCSSHGPNECPEKHFRCMNEIEPETIYKTIKE